MALTSVEISAIAFVLVLAVVVAGLLLYLRQRLRRRKAQLLQELADRPALVQDRAFNRLAMARRESELLASQGGDVSRARSLLAEAQAEYDNRRYERAYRSAQLAHESLVNSRRDAAGNAPVPRPLPSESSAAEAALLSPPLVSAAPKIEKNRAESKFQLSVLGQELSRTRADRPGAPGTQEATDREREAKAAFDRGEYTEAFRLALRGRRALDGGVESLPPSPIVPGEAAAVSRAPGIPRGVDVERTAEEVAAGDRCSRCGYPALAGDTFCRGCGTPRRAATCPKCGAARGPADLFCGRCATSFR